MAKEKVVLTDKQVQNIRKKLEKDSSVENRRHLASKYKVSETTIYRILKKQGRYKDVNEGGNKTRDIPEKDIKEVSIVRDETLEKIIKEYDSFIEVVNNHFEGAFTKEFALSLVQGIRLNDDTKKLHESLKKEFKDIQKEKNQEVLDNFYEKYKIFLITFTEKTLKKILNPVIVDAMYGKNAEG